MYKTPKASCEESQASPVREIHNVKDEILDALNGMFMGLKTAQDENSERVRDLESEIRDVQNDLREIRTSVQYVPGNLRRLGSDVHLVRNKICPEDTCRAGGDTWEEDECDCRQCERERNGAYLDENKGWGDEQDAEHKYKDEKTISEDFALVHDNSGDSWDSNLSNDKRLASSNEESGRSSSNSVNVAQHEHPVQTNQRDFPQIVDFEEPRDLATIDNHHLTGFRNALVEFQELATKFSIMPPDASGNLTIEVC